MQNKQKRVISEVQDLLRIAMGTTDIDEAEDIFQICCDKLNAYHMRDRSLVDDAREKWKLCNLYKSKIF